MSINRLTIETGDDKELLQRIQDCADSIDADVFFTLIKGPSLIRFNREIKCEDFDKLHELCHLLQVPFAEPEKLNLSPGTEPSP